MKLIIQPDAGVAPVVTAIKQAKKSIDILIFRFDREEITRALEAAVGRGVAVRALIAHTHTGSDKVLRNLELRLLAAGVTVSRTDDDLIRYHGKMMIVDGRVLHVYGFNLTRLDIAKSRSLGVITKNPKLVQEALKLFKADDTRQPYTAGCDRFVVSPENARERLAAFISGARKQLLIYDPQVTDDAMLRLITQRINAGVDVRIIGKVEAKWKIKGEKYPGRRLHVRAIIRDGRRAFIGSQSLRRLQLEKRREIGVIVNDKRVVKQMMEVFEQDWAQTESGKKREKKEEKAEKEEARGLPPRRGFLAEFRRASGQPGVPSLEPEPGAKDRPALRHVLRTSPEVHRRHAMDAADRAVRRAGLFRAELAPDIGDGVGLERHARIPALLRAVVDQALFADVEISRARAASPLVRLPVGEVVLEAPNPGIEILDDLPGAADGRGHVVVDLAFRAAKRLEAAGAVVNDADRGREAEIARAGVDGARVLGVLDPSAHDGVDVHVEGRVPPEILQLPVEHAEALLRDFVRVDVVDADLQKVEPGPVQRRRFASAPENSRW